ncbi:C40 family peptidase [Salegentibacter salegens]|uniref:NlpC/P60 family protein n=1 Tax=Salegentibacter salegens TaxID=143223 RepID=A0A1M7N732_9FLAO|nr:C40 family peptidase [Salegentibacter salegens]PRX45668.1 NlpC/P60 family protein [Salegentibacter salegens]SHM99430.1 NlpC/P60 family protein [Salegentibacter salegens]
MQKVFKFLFLGFFLISLISCGSSRSKVITSKSESNRTKRVSHSRNTEIEPASKKVYNVISKAKSFEGTRYKYGGTTKRGMDCSGLIYTSFLEEDIAIPRTSRAMSLEGERLYIKQVAPGDLLFFETNKNRKVINHVGLVVERESEKIYFIHSSTSRGVIISSLSEPYWNGTFVMARRIL